MMMTQKTKLNLVLNEIDKIKNRIKMIKSK